MSAEFDSRPETYEHIGVVRGYLAEVVKQLLDRAQDHDASKLVDPELATFDEFTPKLKHSTFGSDEYKGFLVGMGEGLQHHYRSNRHHPEHFPNGIDDMSLIDLIEMICDWLAATQRHADGDIRRSIVVNQARFGYSDPGEAAPAQHRRRVGGCLMPTEDLPTTDKFRWEPGL